MTLLYKSKVQRDITIRKGVRVMVFNITIFQGKREGGVMLKCEKSCLSVMPYYIMNM
jgi:hypothetical protein